MKHPTAPQAAKKGVAEQKKNFAPLSARMNMNPLSVNKCWRGRRFKTPAYDAYEKEMLFTLPPGQVPEPPYRMVFVFGLSNMQGDVDNPCKPTLDIITKKYRFNDADVHEIELKKVRVKKGQEFVFFLIQSIV